jgi:hypothetical protein
MAKPKRIVPAFMKDNPDDSFMFLMPLSIKPDLKEDMGNSYFRVAIKNLTKNEHFSELIAPEVFFTHFKLQKAYKNGKLDKYINKKLDINNATYKINTQLTPDEYDVKLGLLLEDNYIGQVLGWKHRYLKAAKEISCCIIKKDSINIIIPHYAIAIYYYYRSTILREATLRCNLESLYYGYDCNPDDASIIVPKYVKEDDTPFIHRFLCQTDAVDAFQSIGTYINAYIRNEKDNNPNKDITLIPIKAKFPQREEFSISVRQSSFEQDGEQYHFVHEITDDDSPIGFTRFTTIFQGYDIVTDPDDISDLPTVPSQEPSETTERLESQHGSRRYRQNNITSERKKKCSSLKNVELLTDKVTDDDALQKLKIFEEVMVDESVDQSSTASTDSNEKRTRQVRVSSKGKEFAEIIEKEYIHNFDEFKTYTNYMKSQNAIEDLNIQDVKKMKTVMNGENGNANSKCKILGRERQYITATFTYKERYIGLLELENRVSSSTWVLSSKEPFSVELFEGFLDLYVDDNKSINELKKMYDGSLGIKFKTKNHEKTEVLDISNSTRWVAGVLGKIIS